MSSLLASAEPLAARYDVALLDLDGVVYVGPLAVSAAPAALAEARAVGMRMAFVTNNAARPPAAVAEHLTALGVPAKPGDVITSAQAAAHYLADRLTPNARVLACGTTGIVEALRERGLQPVFDADDEPVAVLQGYSPTLNWAQLAEAAVAIRRGALWVATNLDATVPSARGPLPGNGSLVAALAHATNQRPISTGKPDPTMHRETVERSAAERPLVVGDRLDTDIEGARAVGCASLLVFSGVATPAQVLRAGAQQRPDYLADDLSGIMASHPGVDLDGPVARCGAWTATAVDEAIGLSSQAAPGDGPSGDGLDGLRAVTVLCWQFGAAAVTGRDDTASTAIQKWGIGQ